MQNFKVRYSKSVMHGTKFFQSMSYQHIVIPLLSLGD